MKRTVVSFEPFGDITTMKLEDAPDDIPGLGEHAAADLSDLTGTLVQRGEELLNRLAAHNPVREGLERVLQRPPNADPSPLYFHIVASGADPLPWEQLYDGRHGRFCALDRRSPIGRIARRHRDIKERAFDPPLHIVAVLSATQRTGVPQLKTLLRAVGSADAAAIGARLHVITAEKSVQDAIDATDQPNVTSELLAPTASGLEESIALARPDILHLLCHGGATAGVRTLEFATIPDFRGDEGTRSVRLTPGDLVQALKACDPWLVILSACQTAEASDTSALAHALVSSGIPAVAGMRRLVDLSDINRFCEALYPEVLATIRKTVDPTGPPGERVIDWAETFTAPRRAMSEPDPCTADGWSDPVLYVQADPFRVYVTHGLSVSTQADLRGQLAFWEGLRSVLDPQTSPQWYIAYVDSRIAGLRAELSEAGDS
ncbi:CHAT domain-containing protein [Streptacidiphilus sp. EB103A]|uniref:CHAT domain-containing protein n=1 Tax=Streptacidiphilus sp. EB103A TaxID=3156275 RepID=UPI00351186BB